VIEQEIIRRLIAKLNGMIAIFDQAIVLGGRTRLEREAGELLKDARLKLIQEVESRPAGRGRRGISQEALRKGLAELEQALPGLLKYPSRLPEAESTVYGVALTLLLEEMPDSPQTSAIRDFLAAFHAALSRRRRVVTWQNNGRWFAAKARLEDGREQPGEEPQEAASEREALEMLYALHPELRS